jgi:predicted ATPase
MITKLHLENFKSFKRADISFTSLTVLTGLNNSGKSSVIQALRMLNTAVTTTNRRKTNLPDHDVLFSNLRNNLSKDDYILISAGQEDKAPVTLRINIDDGNERLDYKTDDKKSFPDIQYISASRLGPRNQLPLQSNAPDILTGDTGEYVIGCIEKHSTEKIKPELARAPQGILLLKDNIDAWLSVISPGIRLSYTMQPAQNVAAPLYNGILPSESGFGLSYILPVITLLLLPTEDNSMMLLIENPEAHLHPQGQSAIGQLIAMSAACGKQIVVETHSDHVIDGIRLACKKEKIKDTEVSFHFLKREDDEHETDIESPVMHQDGKLSFWPDGFFDQGLIDAGELL